MKIDTFFAARLIEEAVRRGADYSEAYLRTSKNLSVEVKGQKVDAIDSSIDFGYSLRLIRDGRLGFSFSTDVREADAIIEKALEASRWTERDDFLDLPEPRPTQSLEIFDDSISSAAEGDVIRNAMTIEKAAFDADRRIAKVRKASASISRRTLLIMNSKGVDATFSSTAATAQIMVVAEEYGESQMGWEFDGSRFIGDLSFEGVGRGAADRALRLLGARKMNSIKAPVILDNSVAVEFLGILSSLLSAESVQKGKSLLAGRLGHKVLSPILSIVDDGTLPRRLGSRPFDDEGLTTSRKYLVRDGVLACYMHNLYTARKEGVESTGNAVRGFSSLPSVGPSNLVIDVLPGHAHSGELFRLPERCLYVSDAMGIHTANPISGEFSIGVSGLWIEKGEIKHPVKEAVISGNILDFFGRVEAAGDDFRFYGNMASPSLLFGPTDISA